MISIIKEIFSLKSRRLLLMNISPHKLLSQWRGTNRPFLQNHNSHALGSLLNVPTGGNTFAISFPYNPANVRKWMTTTRKYVSLVRKRIF